MLHARFRRAAFLISVAAVASVMVQGSQAAGPPDSGIEAVASSGCRTTSTSTSRYGNSLSTTVTWCWNGSVVTSISPTGGNTTYEVNGDGSWFFNEWDKWSYCCVGQAQWHMNKIAEFFHNGDPPFLHACLRNELRLNGNGTYSTNPGNWDDHTFDGNADCA